MQRTIAGWSLLFAILAGTLLVPTLPGQEPPKDKDKTAAPVAPPFDADAVAKLVAKLKSSDFKTRELAGKELLKLEEIPDALRAAASSKDLEVRRRAQQIVDVITARLDEKAFQAMLADLHKVEIDRFIRRMIVDPKFADDKQWQIVQTLARAVTKRANELGEREYAVPDLDPKSLALADLTRDRVAVWSKRLLLRGPDPRFTSISGCVVLSTGGMPRVTGINKSLVIVDGDFTGATGLDNCLLIVRGNVGRVTGIQSCIILATGNFEGATVCRDSFVQVNNQRIRFTGSDRSVFIKTTVKTTGPTTSRTLTEDKGPLQMLKFSQRKTDAELKWGKEVNGLTVALAPTDQPDKYLLRWKNVSKGHLEMPWTRLHTGILDSSADDLLGHVYLKGPDGKLAPARSHIAANPVRAPRLPRSVVLGPGQTHEEVIDLWTYVQKPGKDGVYELKIELDVANVRFRWDHDAAAWTGKLESNTLEIRLGR